MIGYVCKYTPVELLSALDAEPVRVQAEAASFDCADACMHPNVCSYAKSVLEAAEAQAYDGFVLTTCCDSIRRLHDALRSRHPGKFVYLLDLPRKSSDATVGLYADQLRDLVRSYREFSGHGLRRACLVDLLADQRRADAARRAARDADGTPPGGRRPVRVGLVGARYGSGLPLLLADNGVEVAFDLTCIGIDRAVGAHMPARFGELSDDALLDAYARALLSQVPCLRMSDVSARDAFLAEQLPHVDGIVYHTVKFCDIYSYEYARLHAGPQVPVLKVETDTTRQSEGQVRTRVEAFIESLGGSGAAKAACAPPFAAAREKGEKMYSMGIDSGSTSTNVAILDGDRELVAHVVVRTGARSADSADRAVQQALDAAGLSRGDVGAVVSTGYGRVSVGGADRDVTEISCHARGARFFDPQVRTILDIGGQDSKAIRLDDAGDVADFAMNDKCAAGTGRFLEAMARTLEVGIEELGALSARSARDVEISSMCTVFAESEVISLIAENVDKADIAHGVHAAIAGKAQGLLRRVHGEPAYMMTGGVAKNPGVVAAVEERIGAPLRICAEPEIVGAVGAALYGLDSLGC